MTAQREKRGNVRSRLLLLSLCAGWLCVLYLIAVSSLPYNPASIGFFTERNVRVAVPEGWGFFTRNPRETDLTIYVEGAGGWQKSAHMPIASAANLFGLDRLPRAESVEAGMILSEFRDPKDWHSCRGTLDSCLSLAPVESLRGHWRYPVLRGSVAFVRQEPIPWAWFRSRNQIAMPRSIIVTSIQ